MARKAVSVEERQNRVLQGSIENAKVLQDTEVPVISRLTGIPKSTLYAKIRSPDTFTVRELRLVFKALKYPVEEKERIAREAL